ncbi:arabinan endo-1,5-alpha-L-arabinosidase [Ruminococcus sp. YE71]|uniref:family 43 glycosylhydrolase n=1 Tax=unclassified Ruminococcus TaxID=2608920 RepID=UPI000885611D|nr:MULTISPECIES: family 43 glycosylhydrolase [unclassified Ruminococcus]SDA31286.1 arabinan endo-1,5-alpha-L-arabinosidase [Ruminococcus sp. YE78]SFW51211.1 arabinan endo-1,5-alpha-L-arabinosidase [Ruminococcus sp. YE71]
MKKQRIGAALLAIGLGISSIGINSISADAAGRRVSVHDPSIIKTNGMYYVFGSHIDAAQSSNLIDWDRFTNGYARTNNVEFGNLSDNLKKAFAWSGEDLEDCAGGFAVWAPDVIWNPDFQCKDGTKGAYVMYFCTSSTYKRSVICYAWSKTVKGPYTFGDTLIYSGFYDNDSYVTSNTKRVNRKYTTTNIDELISKGEVTYNNNWFSNHDFNNYLFPNAIDPTIYYGTDGKMYMTYGSWSGGIFTLEINPKTGRVIHPKTGTTSDGRMVDSYFGTKIAGGYYKSGEGPFIEYNADTGYYYLWTTYGGLTSTGGYNMRVSRSKSPLGPFVDPAGNQAVLNANTNLDSVGLKVMGNYKFSTLDRAYMACGHNSVLRDDDGQWYLFYHARFDDGGEGHQVRVHQMYFNADGWPVVTPFEYAGDKLSKGGYNESDIVGKYEYINHGNSTDGKIINYKTIYLNSDGSISGDASGSWKQSSSSSDATLVIGGKTYKGHFYAGKNEKGTKVMSFTAVGSNNQSVWGAKNDKFTGSDRDYTGDYTNAEYDLVFDWDTVRNEAPGASLKISGTNLLSGVSYFIANKNSGLSLDLPEGKTASGTNIQQWEANGCFAQQFRIIAENDGWCRIASVGDETKVITVTSSADGANAELATYTGADTQLFKVVENNGYYAFLTKCSGGKSSLDVFEWSTENGGNIAQYPYNTYDCQLFTVTPVHPAINDGLYSFRRVTDGKLTGNRTVKRLDDGRYSLTEEDGKTGTYTIKCNADGSYALVKSDGSESSYVLEPVYKKATEPDPQPDPQPNGETYPKNINVVTNSTSHQIRFTWDKVEGADRYGIAAYIAGKWKIQTQSLTDTTFTTPKNMTPGKTYKVAIAARVNGTWDVANAIKNAVTVVVM